MRVRLLIRATLMLLVFVVVPPLHARDYWRDVDRIVAIGDIHGDYEQYRAVMQMAGLIDDDGNWTGERTHLVQTGDIPDRGADSYKIIIELMALQKQARRAGGYIHLLIGNHEAMNVYGDLRYVHPGEYASLVTDKSQDLQARYFNQYVNHLKSTDPEAVIDEAFRQKWQETYPPGFVEHRLLWQPGGDLGDWVANHNAVIKINNMLFVHGGLNPHVKPIPVKKINRQIQRELSQTPLEEDALAVIESGPLWYRGLVQNPEETELPALESMLDYYQAEHIVVGHTPTEGMVNTRLDGKVVMIDVGLAEHYNHGLAALLVEGGELFALHRGVRLALPTTESERIKYYREIAEIEPDPESINQVLNALIESSPPEPAS